MATRVVLYARVSPSGELRNPSAQLRTLRSWADERSWQVVAEFSDHVSGDPARRSAAPPGLCGALGMLQRGEADLLLVVALDRLVRSAAGILELVQDVQSWGGRVV
jgi:DNA invertase Pin-like site-specific DNA recombinase